MAASDPLGPALEEAQALMAERRFADAEERAAVALESYPRSAELLGIHAQAAAQQGKHYKARLRWRAFRERAPEAEAGYRYGAEAAWKLGLPHEATLLLDELLRRQPDHVPALLSLAQAALDAGEVEVAARRWLAARSGTDDVAFYAKGTALLVAFFERDLETDLAPLIASRLIDQPAPADADYLPQICMEPRHRLGLDPRAPDPVKDRSALLYDYLQSLVTAVLPAARSDAPSGDTHDICRVFFDVPGPDLDAALQRLIGNSASTRLFRLFVTVTRTKEAAFDGFIEALLRGEVGEVGDGGESGKSRGVPPDRLYDLAIVASVVSEAAFEKLLAYAASLAAQTSEPHPAITSLAATFRDRALLVESPRRRAASASPSGIEAAAPRLRIAVCVSGQLRGFERALPTWQRFGWADHDVRFFIHTWRKIGRKRLQPYLEDRTLSGRLLEAFATQLRSSSAGAMTRQYPHIFAVDSDEEVTDAQLRELYGTDHVVVEDDRDDAFADFNNSRKMYYKVAQAHRLWRESGFEADLVMRIRPDKAVESGDGLDWSSVLDSSDQGRVVYADYGALFTFNYTIGDQFAVATPPLMDAYARTYQNTLDAQSPGRYAYPTEFVPGQSPAMSVFQAGGQVRHLEALVLGELLDPDRIEPQRILELLELDIAARSPTALDERFLEAAREDVRAAAAAD